jgi:HlyD family secretion protein
MTVKRIVAVVVIVALSGGGIWWWQAAAARKKAAAEPEMETATVERGDLTVTVSASGLIEPLTTVEVKSRSGGEIKRIFVEAGDTVTARQLIAQIDPTQIKSRMDQAAATVQAGQATMAQRKLDAALQQVRTSTDITQAVAAVESARANVQQVAEQVRQDELTTASAVRQSEASVNAARARYAQAEASARAEPELQSAGVANARASLDAARQNLAKLKAGSRPQEIAEAQASLRNAEAAARNADASLKRQRALLDKGFVSRQAVDDAQQTYDQAVAQRDSAQENLSLVLAGSRAEDIAQAEAQVAQAEASLRLAQTNSVQVELKQRDLEAAREAVREAEAGLASAQARRSDVQVRRKQLEVAQASVRQAEAALIAARGSRLQDAASRQGVQVALADLRRQTLALNEATTDLGYTNVYAPRAGVIMQKLVEEGSVVPAGTAALKEGTGLVTIADTSKLYVLADVDETDMERVAIGQKAEITASVLADRKLKGHVVKIFPQGKEDQNVVRFQVRVQIEELLPALRPGMTADVTVTVAQKKDVLQVPDVCIKREKGQETVLVMTAPGQEPEEREIKAGLSNWDQTEILSGLKEGETVLVPPPPGTPLPSWMGGGSKQQQSDQTRRRMMMQMRNRSGGSSGGARGGGR